MRLRDNQQGRGRSHWQGKSNGHDQVCCADPAGDDNRIRGMSPAVCLDSRNPTGRQTQAPHGGVRNDRRAKALRSVQQGQRLVCHRLMPVAITGSRGRLRRRPFPDSNRHFIGLLIIAGA